MSVEPLAIDLFCGLGGWTKIPFALSSHIAAYWYPREDAA
jgi:hypothetical protein